MSEFDIFWRRHFGNLPPRPPAFPWWENWVRFHYLPQSKCYADNAEELATTIHRFASVANAVLGDDAPCWISAVNWSEDDLARNEMKAIGEAIFPISLQYAGKYPDILNIDDEDHRDFEIHAAQVTWRLRPFEKLLGLIGEGKIEGNATWTRIDKPVIFYPYCGGMDLYLRSGDEVMKLREEFSAWLSPRPDGL